MTVREVAERLVKKFNEEYGERVLAKLLGVNDEGEIAVLFEVVSQITCGIFDYIEDFAEMLSSELNNRYYIAEKIPNGIEETAWVIVFSTRKPEKEPVRFVVFDDEGKPREIYTE